MHLESCLKKEKPFSATVNHRNLHIDDKELEAIMEREFGKVKYELQRPSVSHTDEKSINKDIKTYRKEYVIVDGYNVIFTWSDLKELAMFDLESARLKLMQILSNYSSFTKTEVILVFDAYRVSGNTGKKFEYNNIYVVFTKERDLADVYIEKLIADIGKNDKVRVVTSDNLIRLSAVRFGVLRIGAAEFEEEVDDVHKKIADFITSLKNNSSHSAK